MLKGVHNFSMVIDTVSSYTGIANCEGKRIDSRCKEINTWFSKSRKLPLEIYKKKKSLCKVTVEHKG